MNRRKGGEWQNGITEACERLRAHLKPAPVRFDARDRQALAYVLDFCEQRDATERETAVIGPSE